METSNFSKSFIFLFTISTFLTSCFTVKTYPIKGTYQNRYTDTVVNTNKEAIWNKIIDFCSQNGLSIKVIDRSSGVIVFDKVGTSCTYEKNDSTTELMNDNAWLVVPKQYQLNAYPHILSPSSVSAEWNLRVKEVTNDSFLIEIYLIYARHQTTYSTKYDKYMVDHELNAYSRGLMENHLLSFIK